MSSKEKFYSSLRGKKDGNEYQNVLKIWDKSETKTIKDYHDFHLKYDVLLLANDFEHLEIIV